MDPQTIAMLAGSLMSSFGGSSDDGLKDIMRFLMQSANAARRMGKSPAMSLPQEQQALAADRGNAGELMAQQRERLYTAAGPELDGSTIDRVANINSRDQSQLITMDSQHMLESLNNRYKMRFQTAPGIAQSAMGAAGGLAQGGGGGDLASSLGQMAQTWAFSQARKPAAAAAPALPAGPAAASSSATVTPTAPSYFPKPKKPGASPFGFGDLDTYGRRA